MIDVCVDEDAIARLRARDHLDVTVTAEGAADDEPAREHSPSSLAEQDVLFCSFLPTNHETMTRLKLVQLNSAGYTQLLGLDLPARGVRACNASGVLDPAIAEWNIAMMINLTRDLRQMIRNQDRGTWERQSRYESEIRGSTVGIWGYGGLGRQTARLAKVMGQTVWVLTRNGANLRPNTFVVHGTGDVEGKLPERVFTIEQKDEFLSGLDFLILAMPQNSKTEGIVGEHELRVLPDHAFLLNPARGRLVQIDPLLSALDERWIAGAALDTHCQYPMPADHPLWSKPNVIMTPHISGSTRGKHYLPRVWSILTENIDRWLAGEPLLNELSQRQLCE